MQVSLLRSLRFRLIASILLIEVSMLSIMVWNNVNTIYLTHTDRLYETALSLAQQLSNTAGKFMVEVDYASLEDYATTILQHNEVEYVQVFDLDQKPVVKVGNTPRNAFPVVDQHPTLVTDGIFDIRADIRMANRPMGSVFIGFSLDFMHQTIQQARNRSITIAAAEILMTIVTTIFLGIYLTRNLRALANAAVSVGEGNFDVLLPVTRADEVGLTAQAFNRMVNAVAERTNRIQEKQEQIQVLLDSTVEAIYGIDLNGICTFVNPACRKILGYQSDQELLNQEIHSLIHHSHPDGSAYPIKQCPILLATTKDEIAHADNEVHWRADGSSFSVEYWSHPIKRNNIIVGAVVTFIDVTERKMNETELRLHRDNLEKLVEERTTVLEQQATIIDQIHDSVISTDINAIIVNWNRGAERLFGYKKEEAIGKPISFICVASERANFESLVIATLSAKNEKDIEMQMQNKKGEIFMVHLSLSIRYDKSGTATGMIAYAIDITQSKLAEENLKRKALELEASNKELAAFSYSVSHDLRTPLRAINGFSTLLLEDYASVLDSTGKNFLHRICAGVNRMAQLIDDLLMLSRVTQEEIHWETVDLSLLANDIISKLRASEISRQIKISIMPGMTLVGDKRLLQIALENLLDNAWKYTQKTPNPEFSFGTTLLQGKEVYYVKDNGAGFNMQYVNKLFGAFQRLHSVDEFEGTGIGLATVQRVIHRLGGEVWAESQEGKGATFYFSLD